MNYKLPLYLCEAIFDNNMANKGVFVTVGTTEFSTLIKTMTSEEVCCTLKSLGYTKLVLQIGKGVFEPNVADIKDIAVEYYRYKESIKPDIDNASLVVSHAGAGSCLECLEAGKSLLVVINEELMNNHQLELAYQLSNDGHLHYCRCSNIVESLKNGNFSSLVPFELGKPELFADFMNDLMGFDTER